MRAQVAEQRGQLEQLALELADADSRVASSFERGVSVAAAQASDTLDRYAERVGELTADFQRKTLQANRHDEGFFMRLLQLQEADGSSARVLRLLCVPLCSRRTAGPVRGGIAEDGGRRCPQRAGGGSHRVINTTTSI